MANEYVSSSELKATLALTGQTFEDADIALALTAASRAVDDLCLRRFYPDADNVQVHRYSPSSSRLLWIDDLITLTTLKADHDGDGTFEETWTLNTDFVLEPLNPGLIDGTNPQPWSVIRHHPKSTRNFPTWIPRSIELTGKFGWPVAPSPVKEATGILAAKLVRRAREAPFGIVAVVDSGEAMRIGRGDPDITALLSPYIKRTLVA